MVNQNTLDLLDAYGFGADIDALETYVMELQDAAGMGDPEVTDAQYDDYFHLLKELKPESIALTRNWNIEDTDLDSYDKFLQTYGMKSIRTIRDLSELEYFKKLLTSKELEFCVSSKIDGHGVRAVYKYGQLVSGSTRGRYKKGRDITRHLKILLPEIIGQLADVPLAEVRGEVYCPYDKFEGVKHLVKTPLSAVTSFLRESATDDVISNLDFCCYQIFADGVEFDTLFNKFQFLKECGFSIPFCVKAGGINEDNFDEFIESVINHFTNKIDTDGLPYANDGIVVAINNVQEFDDFGNEGNTMLGNFALKVGHWESNIYSGKIESVVWCYGKRYITPKAVVEKVVTRNGTTVSTVPLYNIGVMQENGYYPGHDVFFKYGGETGVTLVKPDGRPV